MITSPPMADEYWDDVIKYKRLPISEPVLILYGSDSIETATARTANWPWRVEIKLNA